MKLNNKQLQIIHDATLESYPNEAVIGITKRTAKVLTNIHEDPSNHFKVDTEEFYKNDYIGLVHSHPSNAVYVPEGAREWDICTPSKTDLITQQALDIPFGIIGTDGENVTDIVWWPDYDTPIEGRRFIYGIWDCYGLVKKWYKDNRDMILTDVPRGFDDDEIDSLSKSLLEDTLNFKEVERFRDMKIGDIICMGVGARKINHLAVYIGNGQIYHHMIHQIPKIDNYSKYANFVIKHLRHGDTK